MPGPIIPPPPFTDVPVPPLPPPLPPPPATGRAGHVLGLALCLGGAGVVVWAAAEALTRGWPWVGCVLGAVGGGLAVGALAFAVPVLGDVADLVYGLTEKLLRLTWHERH